MAQTTAVLTNLIEKHHWETDGWLAGNGLRETGTDLGGPAMSCLRVPLSAEGHPLLPVLIRPHPRAAHAGAAAAPTMLPDAALPRIVVPETEVAALIDTGANRSAVSPDAPRPKVAGLVVHKLRNEQSGPGQCPGPPCGYAAPVRGASASRPWLLALQKSTATLEEAIIAELLLGQVDLS